MNKNKPSSLLVANQYAMNGSTALANNEREGQPLLLRAYFHSDSFITFVAL